MNFLKLVAVSIACLVVGCATTEQQNQKVDDVGWVVESKEVEEQGACTYCSPDDSCPGGEYECYWECPDPPPPPPRKPCRWHCYCA